MHRIVKNFLDFFQQLPTLSAMFGQILEGSTLNWIASFIYSNEGHDVAQNHFPLASSLISNL